MKRNRKIIFIIVLCLSTVLLLYKFILMSKNDNDIYDKRAVHQIRKKDNIATGSMKAYNVKKVKSQSLKITGKRNDLLWNQSDVLTDFLSPWRTEKLPKIEFKALWDTEYLFFSFKVFDSQPYINTKDNSINSIGQSDRVELFFRTDSLMTPYYCLEMDPTPRCMDFLANPKRKFNFDWDWPKEDLTIKSSFTDDAYIVEGKITLRSLKKLKLLENNMIEVGVFVAKHDENENPIWITWVDPKMSFPEFHTPTSFGLFNLGKD